MSNQTENAPEKWLIKVVGGLVATIIGTRLFGGDIYIASVWYALLAVALIYVLSFLMLFLWFDLSANESAKKVIWPSVALLLSLAPGRVVWFVIKNGFFLAVILLVIMWAVLIFGAVAMNASGKREFQTLQEARKVLLSFRFWKQRFTQKTRDRKAIRP